MELSHLKFRSITGGRALPHAVNPETMWRVAIVESRSIRGRIKHCVCQIKQSEPVRGIETSRPVFSLADHAVSPSPRVDLGRVKTKLLSRDLLE